VPVLVGWAAVTDTVGLAPLLLFALIFVWTPPHFWALAIKYREDYASVDVPMMPVVTTFERTARQILAYSVLVVVVSGAFGWSAHMGPLYWAAAMVCGGLFVAFAARLYLVRTERRAMVLFHWSISYVTLLFAAMAVDELVRHGW
jgi:protoheme IX farnesyltransferase